MWLFLFKVNVMTVGRSALEAVKELPLRPPLWKRGGWGRFYYKNILLKYQ